MERVPRIDVGGEIYHIFNRANARLYIKVPDTITITLTPLPDQLQINTISVCEYMGRRRRQGVPSLYRDVRTVFKKFDDIAIFSPDISFEVR